MNFEQNSGLFAEFSCSFCSINHSRFLSWTPWINYFLRTKLYLNRVPILVPGRTFFFNISYFFFLKNILFFIKNYFFVPVQTVYHHIGNRHRRLVVYYHRTLKYSYIYENLVNFLFYKHILFILLKKINIYIYSNMISHGEYRS